MQVNTYNCMECAGHIRKYITTLERGSDLGSSYEHLATFLVEVFGMQNYKDWCGGANRKKCPATIAKVLVLMVAMKALGRKQLEENDFDDLFASERIKYEEMKMGGNQSTFGVSKSIVATTPVSSKSDSSKSEPPPKNLGKAKLEFHQCKT